MTQSPAELEFMPDAVARLEEYLRQVRAALAGATDVNADEIEADIREHVENELHDAPRPVPLPSLEEVLTRLGPPSQWGTTNDPTLLHRARHLLGEKLRGARTSIAERLRTARNTLWRGPDDWRLAYLSFGIFALGILSFFVLFPVTIIVSYFLSRAGIAAAQSQGRPIDAARKWLLYPPVVIVSLALLLAVAAWPVITAPIVLQEVHRAVVRVRTYDVPEKFPVTENEKWQSKQRQVQKEQMAAQVAEDRKLLAAIPVTTHWAAAAAGCFVAVGAVALWWMILGVAFACHLGKSRAVFFPLLNRFERRNGIWLAVASLIVLIPWSFTTYEIVRGLM